MSLTLHQKLEMITFSEEGRRKLSQAKSEAPVPVSQAVNAKEKSLKETKSVTPANT